MPEPAFSVQQNFKVPHDDKNIQLATAEEILTL